jgi:crooked neck
MKADSMPLLTRTTTTTTTVVSLNEACETAIARVRHVYERAVANVPSSKTDKKYWRRYIYLWINYALFEEMIAGDIDRTRQIYEACLAVIPHAAFSFSKVWIMLAKFEVRQKRLARARKVLGQAIAKAPKSK